MPASEVEQSQTDHQQQLFLDAFAASGSVGEACLATGVSVGTVDSWGSRDTHGFKSRMAEAGQLALGYYEREIRRRAVEGVEKLIFNTKGERIGSTWQYSDNLLMFRVKRLDPEYKDNYDPRPATAPIVTQIVINWPPGVTPPPDLVQSTVEGLGTVEAEVKELDAG